MKSLKKLIIPAVVLALVLIGLIIWAVLKPSIDDTTSGDTTVSIMTLNTNLVSSVTVDKQDGTSLTVLSNMGSDGTVTYSLSSDDMNNNANYSQDIMAQYVSLLTSFSAYAQVSDGVDFSEYGLDNPLYTVTITMTDGTTHVLLFGNLTLDGSYYYFAVQGETAVYKMAKAKGTYCEYVAINFLDTQIFNYELSQLIGVTFDRTTDNTHLVTTCRLPEDGGTATTFIVTEPFEIEASPYFKNLLEGVLSLNVSSFIDITEDQLAEYGLDEPAFSFQIRLRTGESYTVCFSSDIGGYYYGYTNATEGYFCIADTNINGFETPLLTLLNGTVYAPDVATISSISCEYGDESFEYEIDVESSLLEEDGSVTLNLRNPLVYSSSGTCYAKVLFDAISSINIGGVDLDANPTGDPDITLTFVDDEHSINTLEFVERNSSSYYLFFNGEYTHFYVNSDEIFADGGVDGSEYGFWAAYEVTNDAIDNQINGVYDVTIETEDV